MIEKTPATIIVGTTPTIQFTFSIVDVSDIEATALTIKRDDTTLLTKTLTDATVDTDANTVSYTLTQAETLTTIGIGAVYIQHNWLLEDGTRGACLETMARFIKNQYTGVMSA